MKHATTMSIQINVFKNLLKIFTAFFSLVVFTSFNAKIQAQEQAEDFAAELDLPDFSETNAEGKVVKQIDVEYIGAKTVDRQRILANMLTKVGSRYSQDIISKDLVNLFESGLVEDVQIYQQNYQSGVKVIVSVKTRATVKNVLFRGNRSISSETLKKKADLSINTPVTESQLSEARERVLKYYYKKGFSNAEVSVATQRTSTGFANAVFSINEGQKTIIRKVSFEGNNSISSRQLRQEITTRKKGVFSFLTGSGKLDSYVLEEDKRKIVDYYQSKGFYKAQVVGTEKRQKDNGRTEMVFKINEGLVYNVGSVGTGGYRLFPKSRINNLIKLRQGARYSGTTVKNDIQSIEDLYGSNGYVNVNVTPRINVTSGNILDVSYIINEGEKYYVDKINITGNTKTKDKVIRREIAIDPGEPFNTVAIRASMLRLRNTGFFETVDIIPTDSGKSRHKDINIRVTERKTGSLNFGASFSNVDNLVGFIDISQSNFDITNWPNFTGAGQKFRMGLKAGVKRREFDMSFIEPWFLDKKLAVGIDLFYKELLFLSDDYEQRNIGGDIFLRKPIDKFTYARLEYKLQKVKIHEIDNNASDIIKAEEGDFLQSLLKLSVVRDTRDNLNIPRKGTKIDIGGYYSGGFLGGDVDTVGFNASAKKYITLPYDLIFSAEAHFATVKEHGDSASPPIFERLFLGGAYTLRGFDYREVGPVDNTNEPIGGLTSAWGALELTFPIIEKVRGAVFYDLGTVSSSSWDIDSSNYNSNYGFGARFFIPALGRINLDYGIPIEADAHNDSNGQFNFYIGTRF